MNTWKNLQMLVIVALVVSAAACSLFNKDIKVPQSFTLRMDRAVNAPLQFSVLKDVSTATEETEKYGEDIKSFNIDRITYSVEDFSGSNSPVISGNIEFAPSGSSNFKTLSTFENLNLEEMASNRAVKELHISDEAAMSTLKELLKSGSEITFRLNASTTNNPVAATLRVNIDAQMTVEI